MVNEVEHKIKNEPINVQVGYVHNFADDYLTTIHFLLKQAKENNKNISVFTYTLPIIIISICFLESNINNLIKLFYSPNNLINYNSTNRELTQKICDDFIQLDKTPLLEKYYILLKYYQNIDIKRNQNKYFSKVSKIIDLRNLLIHDKSYVVMPSLGDKDKIVQLLEKQKWLTPNNNLLEPVPQWLPYLEYNNVCIMVKIIFEFYLQYSKLLIPNEEPIYQNKIARIISHHSLMKDLKELEIHYD